MDPSHADYISGLRGLADLLETHELPLPYQQALSFFIHDDLHEALALRELMTDAVTSRLIADTNFAVVIKGRLGGLPASVYVATKIALASPDAVVVPPAPALQWALAVGMEP